MCWRPFQRERRAKPLCRPGAIVRAKLSAYTKRRAPQTVDRSQDARGVPRAASKNAPARPRGRFDYAAIETVANVATRLRDEAKPGQILISPRVLTKVEDAVTVEPIGEFTLKGIRRPLAAYNVLATISA